MKVPRSLALILAAALLAAVVSCAAPSQAPAPCTRTKPQAASRFERSSADRIPFPNGSIFAAPASARVYSGPDRAVILDTHPLSCNFYMPVPGDSPTNGMLHVAEVVIASDGQIYGLWNRSGWIDDRKLTPIMSSEFGTYMASWATK